MCELLVRRLFFSLTARVIEVIWKKDAALTLSSPVIHHHNKRRGGWQGQGARGMGFSLEMQAEHSWQRLAPN